MNDKNKEKFADFLATECRALLIEHLDAVIEAAFETQDDEKPAKAKVSVSFAWEADHSAPRVTSKLNYTVSHKDETERKFNPDQMEFSIEENADTEEWRDAGDRLPDDETLVEVEDEKGDTWKGCFGHNVDLDTTAFQCEDGEFILVENIVRWRHVEKEAVEA